MENDRQYFHSDTCYKRFLYGKLYAEKINELLEKGYIVFDEDGRRILEGFVIEKGEIFLKDENCLYGYIGSQYDDNGKIWLAGDSNYSKKAIAALFCKFTYINPKDIKKIKRLV